jgi:hypothetical protein
MNLTKEQIALIVNNVVQVLEREQVPSVRVQGQGRPIDAPLTIADDRDIHPIVLGDTNWRESWYMNFTDPDQLIKGLCWMGVRPGQEMGELVFIVFEGEKCLHQVAKFDFPISKTIGDERMHFGPAKWECVDPYKEWRMTFDDGSGVTADLTWTSICAPYDWKWWKETNSRHFEHPGRVQGTIKIGGRTIQFNGFGQRDRAWGSRDNAKFAQALWTPAIFSENFAFHTLLITIDDKVQQMGYVYKDGVQSLVSALTYDVIYSYPGGPPRSVLIKIQDEAGRYFEVTGETENTLPILVANNGTEVFKTFNWLKFTCEGQVGYGMIDFWFAKRDAIIRHIELRGDNRSEIYHEFK